MNQTQVYMCPLVSNPLPPRSPSRPSGLSQCTSFECPVSCIELGLVICFTYGNIRVSMLFFQSSHPHLLPQSPKVCSLYLCLFCCLTYRVVITIFLNSIRSDQSLSRVWLFVTPWIAACHMVIYMFKCYSLKSSHPHLLHRVQKSVLYICVSFAVSHIGSSLPSF